MVKAGKSGPCWVAEFEGDEETPSPSASTAMTKYFVGSTRPPGLMASARLALTPENHVGKSTALERSALSVPQVR